MQEYELIDDKTGMQVDIEVDGELTEQKVMATLAEARKQAFNALADKSYRLDDETKLPLEKDQANEKLKRFAAYSMGVKPEEVDVDTGMDLKGRFQLDQLRDDASKLEFLEKKFGADNVNMLNIGGKPKMFYRDPKTKKMTMVDEMGASLADFTADISSEALTTAGAVAGGIAGSVLGPGGTGAGAVAGVTAGSALGGFLTGVTQDVVSEAAAGQQVDFGDIAKTRAINEAIAAPIGLATMGVGRFLSRRAGKNLAKDAAKTMEDMSRTLQKSESLAPLLSGGKIKVPASIRAGQKVSDIATEIADARPKSRVARQYESLRQTIALFQRQAAGKAGTTEATEQFAKTTEKIGRDMRTLVNDITALDKEAGRVIENSMSRRLQELTSPRKLTERRIGERLQTLFGEGESAASGVNKTNWANLDAVAIREGVSVNGKQVASSIRQAAKELAPLDNKPLMQLAKEIEESGPLTFTQLRRRLNQIEDAVPASTEAGFKTAQQVAIAASKAVRGLRGQLVERASPAFQRQYNTTMSYYLDDFLNFKRGAVGRALKEQLGAAAQTPEQVASAVLRSSSNVEQALKSAGALGPEQVKALKIDLQDAYLTKIGLFDSVNAPSGLSFDDDIVRRLFGAHHLRTLNTFNRQLKQAANSGKLIDGTVNRDEAYRLFSAFSGDEKAKIMSNIIKRMKKEAEADEKLVNTLLRKITPRRQGKELLPAEFTAEDVADFAGKFISARPSQVKRAMQELRKGPPEGLEAFQQEFVSQLFRKFSGNPQLANGLEMWNPKAFSDALRGRGGSQLKANIQEVLSSGRVTADEIFAANELLEQASAVGRGQSAALQPRVSGSGSGLQFYVVGDLMRGLSNRFLGWAYGSDMLMPFLRWMASDVGDVQAAKNFEKILVPMLTTQRGIMAMARESQRDPRFMEAVSELQVELAASQEEE